MDLLLHRFRNLTVLVIVIAAQLLLLAYQVKTNQEIRLVRVWAFTAITPLARVIESVRSGLSGFFSDYFILLDVREENKRLKAESGRLKLENQFLKTELSTSDRARALQAFQTRSPSKTIAARIIGNGTGANSKVVLIDRGSASNVQAGMAVITPDGIVGKVLASYPTGSQVLLITDPSFAAGVISEKAHVHGTLKGKGQPNCMVDYVQNEEKVEEGEMFYTSGDDRVFPKGLPVGTATTVRPGKGVKDIYVTPSGFKNGFEEVLVVLEGVHQALPEPSQASPGIHLTAPPPSEAPVAISQPTATPSALNTDADRLLDRYKKVGESQGHAYGKPVGKPPNFNINPDDPNLKKPPTPPGTAPLKPPTNPAEPPAQRAPSN